MFLGNERLIVVDQKVSPLPAKDKAALREIGVETMLCEGFASWEDIAPTPYSFNMSTLDDLVNENRSLGLKSLVAMYVQTPDWVPGSFPSEYMCPHWHVRERFLDPFDPMGFEEELEFLFRALAHLESDDVCCYYATPRSGNRIVPAGLGGATMEEAIQIATTRQSIFADFSSDLFTCFHPATIPDNVGTEHLDAVYIALLDKFPVHMHHRILWTFFASGGCQWRLNHDRYWVGAEYAENVVRNASRIQEWGAYGLIVAPTYWAKGPVHAGEFELGEIEKALKILGGDQWLI